MAFTSFVNSTTTDADDMNENFYFVAQGDRQPFTLTAAGSLTAVDATYDLGTSATTWKTVYAQNLNLVSVTSANQALWFLLSETTLADTAASIEVTGLNGDVDVEFMILFRGISHATNSAATPRMILEGDSGTTYGWQLVDGAAGVVSASRATSITSWEYGTVGVPTTTVIGMGFNKSILYAKTGNERTMLNMELRSARGAFVSAVTNRAMIWNNTASTITTIKIFSSTNNFGTNTNLQIWARR